MWADVSRHAFLWLATDFSILAQTDTFSSSGILHESQGRAFQCSKIAH